MQSSDIPAKFNIPFADAAGPGFIRPIPQASQIGTQPGAASLTDGFPPANFSPVGAGGIPPFGQDFNGLFKQITLWNQWQSAGGHVIYDATFAASIGGYPKGAILISTGRIFFWRNLVENNTSNPDAGGAGWIAFSLPEYLQFYSIDTSGTANVITIAPSPPISAYSEGLPFLVKVANNSTGPVTMSVNGLSSQTVTDKGGNALVPGALLAGGIYLFCRDATKIQCLTPEGSAGQRPGLTAPRNYYVNASTGSDSNDGLSPTVSGGHGPFLTIQKALDQVPLYNMNGFTISINIANGTYNLSTALSAPQTNGSGSVAIIGNTGSPSSVVLNGLSTTVAFFLGGTYSLTGLTVQVTGTPPAGNSGDGLVAFGPARVNIENCRFGAANRGHIVGAQGARISINTGTITIFGGGLNHIRMESGATIFIPSSLVANFPDYVISIPGVNFGQSFIYADNVSTTYLFYKTLTGAGNVVGTRYIAATNAIINTPAGGPNYYPGTVAGITTSGGQYL